MKCTVLPDFALALLANWATACGNAAWQQFCSHPLLTVCCCDMGQSMLIGPICARFIAMGQPGAQPPATEGPSAQGRAASAG